MHLERLCGLRGLAIWARMAADLCTMQSAALTSKSTYLEIRAGPEFGLRSACLPRVGVLTSIVDSVHPFLCYGTARTPCTPFHKRYSDCVALIVSTSMVCLSGSFHSF